VTEHPAIRESSRRSAMLWLRAERVAELLIAAAERRPADHWRLLGRLCGETRTR
jgi:hypothetical protein